MNAMLREDTSRIRLLPDVNMSHSECIPTTITSPRMSAATRFEWENIETAALWVYNYHRVQRELFPCHTPSKHILWLSVRRSAPAEN